MTGLHVGVLGVGRIGAFHTRTLVDHPMVDRITVWDPRSEAVAGLRDTVDVAKSPADLLDAGLDAVLVCSSSATHAELLSTAVQR
jgi:myo-inositol 2-dehydrogenase/D-chiro-inositol 1-dehydrogenase